SLYRARRQDEHPVRTLAAERLLPGERCDIEFWPVETLRECSRRCVTNREAFTVTGDPVAVRHAHAGSRAIPGEDDVGCEIDFAKIGQFAVRRPHDSDVF